MPLPRSLARFNLAVTNRITGPFAGRLPGFAVLEHVGRRSGTVRRTPVNVFRHDGRSIVITVDDPGTAAAVLETCAKKQV